MKCGTSKKKREMIVRGFEKNTPSKETVTKITSIMVDWGWNDKVEDGGIFTFGAMVSSGLVRFKSMGDKADFKKMLANTSAEDSPLSEAGLWIGDNVDKFVRMLAPAAMDLVQRKDADEHPSSDAGSHP